MIRRAFIVLLIVFITLVAPIEYAGVNDKPLYPLAVVSGVSMEPILHTGDVVFLKKVKVSQINVGDVIVYKWIGGKYVIHRVVFIYKFKGTVCFVTWGDDRRTNPVPDPGYPSECGYVKVKDPITGRAVIASGIPSYYVIGEVIHIGKYIIKIPYIGSLAIALRRG